MFLVIYSFSTEKRSVTVVVAGNLDVSKGDFSNVSRSSELRDMLLQSDPNAFFSAGTGRTQLNISCFRTV